MAANVLANDAVGGERDFDLPRMRLRSTEPPLLLNPWWWWYILVILI